MSCIWEPFQGHLHWVEKALSLGAALDYPMTEKAGQDTLPAPPGTTALLLGLAWIRIFQKFRVVSP